MNEDLKEEAINKIKAYEIELNSLKSVTNNSSSSSNSDSYKSVLKIEKYYRGTAGTFNKIGRYRSGF